MFILIVFLKPANIFHVEFHNRWRYRVELRGKKMNLILYSLSLYQSFSCCKISVANKFCISVTRYEIWKSIRPDSVMAFKASTFDLNSKIVSSHLPCWNKQIISSIIIDRYRLSAGKKTRYGQFYFWCIKIGHLESYEI